MRTLKARGQTGRRHTVFSDSQATRRRAQHDELGPGQQWARAIIEVAICVMARNNHIWVCWVPAHRGSRATRWRIGWQMRRPEASQRRCQTTSSDRRAPPHLARMSAERRSAATVQYIEDHVRPERRYLPPGGGGFRKRAMRRVRKSTAQCYYQLLSGHAAIGSFLHDHMTPTVQSWESLWVPKIVVP